MASFHVIGLICTDLLFPDVFHKKRIAGRNGDNYQPHIKNLAQLHFHTVNSWCSQRQFFTKKVPNYRG